MSTQRAIQVLRYTMGGGGVEFPDKKLYKGVALQGEGVGLKFPEKKCYITFE